MSYLVPSEFVTKMVDAGESKLFMSTRDTLIRAYMAGAILALAAVFAITITIQTGSPLLGAAGWATIFLRGMLCNWMVSLGVVGAMISTTVSGKAIAMWMPVMLFFYMGFEHSVVNMFLFPFGMIMGGDFSVMDYMIWNEIPTALGNLVGGLAFTGLTLYTTHRRTALGRAPGRTQPCMSGADV